MGGGVDIKNMRMVVNSFMQMGYTVADKWLAGNDLVDDIGIILGAEDDYILPVNQVPFGNPDRVSSFFNSKVGVIFSGNIGRMIENLPYLPKVTSVAFSNCSKIHEKSITNFDRDYLDFTCENFLIV